MKKITFLILMFTFILVPSAFAAEKPYTLAYPGMLPDNPLYKLKVLRDRISLITISDPNKKIDFYLLLADKGISATQILADQGKTKLAKETALKGENNYTLLTYAIRDNKWKISQVKFKKVETAALKHQEVLNNIIKKVSGDDKKTFEIVLYFSKTNLNEIKNVQNSLKAKTSNR